MRPAIFIIGVLLISFATLPSHVDGIAWSLSFILDQSLMFLLNKVFVTTWNPIADILFPSESSSGGVKNQLTTIISKIEQLDEDFKQSIMNLTHFISVETKSNKIKDLRDTIESKFDEMLIYLNYTDKLENQTKLNLISSLSEVDHLTTEFHIKLFGSDKTYLNSVINEIRDHQKLFSTKTSESENVVLHKFYLTLLSVEYKALLLQKIGCYYRRLMGQGNFTTENEVYETLFKNRVRESFEFMRGELVKANRQLYKNDPETYDKGVTYGEVTRFNQIYFTQEANFNTCNGKCEDYSKPRQNFNEIHGYDFSQRKCAGTLHGCKSESPYLRNVWVPKSPDSDRRYFAFQSTKLNRGESYGKVLRTDESQIVIFRAWPRGFVNCDICRCMCDDSEDKKSIRYFSLNSLKSDTHDNMVVSGIKIALQNKTFHLKIHQSKLLPLGRIETNGSNWKTDGTPEKERFTLKYNKNGIHIGTAQAYMHKNPNHVVTGVKFIEIKDHLALQITLNEFNFTTGELIPGKDLTESNSFTTHHIKEGKNGDRPTKYKDNEGYDKEGIIHFGPSSLKEDVGQSTVPFIDLQPLISTYAALSGVGLKFRFRENSGGFITPSILTYPMFLDKIEKKIESTSEKH